MRTRPGPSSVRCPWVPPDDGLMRRYHDREWGVPVHRDRKLFEFLVLEVFQAGLSWRTVLYRRAAFRRAFAGFDFARVARYGPKDVRRLLQDVSIIRNRAKIEAAVENARRLLEVRKEFGTFARYMWSQAGKPRARLAVRRLSDYPAFTPEAVAWSQDLKRRGFRFLGPTVVYAHMQAVGMVNDHSVDCAWRASAARPRAASLPAGVRR